MSEREAFSNVDDLIAALKASKLDEQLIAAADGYCKHYENDDRLGIVTDIWNAFAAGSAWQARASLAAPTVQQGGESRWLIECVSMPNKRPHWIDGTIKEREDADGVLRYSAGLTDDASCAVQFMSEAAAQKAMQSLTERRPRTSMMHPSHYKVTEHLWPQPTRPDSVQALYTASQMRTFADAKAAHAVAEVRAKTIEECAKVAAGVKNGYSANIRADESEQELVRDPDGPWVLNSDVAAAIRALNKETGNDEKA